MTYLENYKQLHQFFCHDLQIELSLKESFCKSFEFPDHRRVAKLYDRPEKPILVFSNMNTISEINVYIFDIMKVLLFKSNPVYHNE